MAATTETVTGNLPPYLEAAYKEAAERGLRLSQEPYENYPHRKLAPQAHSTNRALNLSQQIGSYSPYLRASESMANRGIENFPAGYRHYKDPYQGHLVKNIATEGQRAFKEKIMPELDARFIRLGQHGSSKHARMARNAARDIQKEILSQQEDAMSRGYQQSMQGFNLDRSRALEGSGLLNRIGVTQQAGQLADIQSLREAGMISQSQEQAMLDQAYEEWKERKRHPYDKLREYFAVLQGTPTVPSSYSRRDISRPSDIYHGADWRNMMEGIGINALGRYGRDLLGKFEFASGGSVPSIPPYLVGI